MSNEEAHGNLLITSIYDFRTLSLKIFIRFWVIGCSDFSMLRFSPRFISTVGLIFVSMSWITEPVLYFFIKSSLFQITS